MWKMVFYTIFCNFARYLISAIAPGSFDAVQAISMNLTELPYQMKLHKLIFIPCVALAQISLALDVTSTPGKLKDAIGTQTDISSLTVNGQLDAADFEFIADKLPALRSLDLSNAYVAAYEGDPLITSARNASAEEIPPYAFAGSQITSIKLPKSITAIGEGAFLSTPIASIEIPSSVKSIGAAAFSGCRSLSTVTIPSTVSSIGTHLFMGCDKLKKATLPAALTTVPAATFADCRKLENVSISSAVTAIDSAAFAGCSSMTAIDLGNRLKTIGAAAFKSSGLKEINLQNSSDLGTIGPWAFADCASLTSAQIPDGVASIGEGAFWGDAALVTTNFPSAADRIENYTYNGAANLDASHLSHNEITFIGDYALRGMSSATKFEIPASLESIGDYAMEDWTSLKEMTAYTPSVPSAGVDVWAGVNQPAVKVYVNTNMQSEFTEAPQWKEFDIVQSTGVSDDITADADDSGVKAFFSGTDLIVKATTEIDNVRVYDSAARQWVYVEPASEEIAIDTAAWNSRIYIVAVVLADGRTASIKLARR